MNNENHVDELKKETVKSSVSIILSLILSPISIFMTIWLTNVLATSDLKIIDSNITPVFHDIEIESTHLEYIKNDSYVISVIQKYLSYGSSLDITLARLKLSTAKKLLQQKDLINQQFIQDLKNLEHNKTVLTDRNFNSEELRDIRRLHVQRKYIGNWRNSREPEKALQRHKDSLDFIINDQKRRISDMRELFEYLENQISNSTDPDNYQISLAILNAGAEAGAILPSTTISVNKNKYPLKMTESSMFGKFKTGQYFSIPPDSIKVIKATFNLEAHQIVLKDPGFK